METLHFPTRAKWRQWLSRNHSKVADGIWLKYYKKDSDQPTLQYEESVLEALCYGWIDSIIKKIDDASYCRKFTPRKPDSKWSPSNKKRVAKLVKDGLMTKHGQALIDAAKKSGRWDEDTRPQIDFDMPEEFRKALSKNKKAKQTFDELAMTYQKRYVGWITTAKREETRQRRVADSIKLLARGEKLGLK